MYTLLSKSINRPKREIFDNLTAGIYLLRTGLISKTGFDESNNIVGVCLYSEQDYLIVGASEYRFNYRYKALEDTVLVKVEVNEVCIEKLLSQVSDLEDLLLIKGFKLSLQPLEASRFYHFANWIKKKTGKDNLDFLTHEEIANFLNSSRVTIARIVSELFQQGRLLKDKGKIDKILIDT